ncbi:hypothetical protein SAMN05444358_101132 [Ruegeria halocynthiae]|uniref:Uncharacterized protein n=1 Tax=Ruegeria halocynthiae TaxID=985054 RepID=A0A1H2REQ9_9RHOB|nr:hypothetical protein [Ruegeria halocynthiae]SDW17698.1 hypothetical protein SAMN05444358_101132 [Ruegeria halocynthiae]
MSTATLVFAVVTLLYLMVGRMAYCKIIVPTRYRDALGGDVDAMVSIIHEQEKSLVHYLTYAGWLIFYPVIIVLGWIIARLDIDF